MILFHILLVFFLHRRKLMFVKIKANLSLIRVFIVQRRFKHFESYLLCLYIRTRSNINKQMMGDFWHFVTKNS